MRKRSAIFLSKNVLVKFGYQGYGSLIKNFGKCLYLKRLYKIDVIFSLKERTTWKNL